MNRRTHLKQVTALAGAAIFGPALGKQVSAAEQTKNFNEGKVVTVTGEIDPSEMGLTLPQEHIFSKFGDDPSRYPSYPEQEAMEAVVPYLKKLKKLGVKTIVDTTSAYIGRHPEFLKRVSEESGIQIITNTGYYGVAKERYVPMHVRNEEPEAIADRWINEIRKGIDETGVYPGFIKTSAVVKPLLESGDKLMSAAAIAHKETGLPIQTETGRNFIAANEVIDNLTKYGVDAEAWTWLHAHKVEDDDHLVRIAKMGGFVSLDGLTLENSERILGILKVLKARDVLHKALVSHDGVAYGPDGRRKDFHFLVTDFKPRFLAYGFSEDDYKLITQTNPANAFVVKKRLL